MAAPRKFDEETRARAVRMYQDRIREHGDSMASARRHVGALLDINPATLRNWVTRAEQGDTGPAAAAATESDELQALRREVVELRRANEFCGPRARFSRRRRSTADCGDRRLPRRTPGQIRLFWGTASRHRDSRTTTHTRIADAITG